MAKNRKNQSAAVRFGDLIKTFLLCAMIGGAGVGFVWQKGKIGELGRQISQREKRLVELSQQNEKMRKQLGLMRSPQFLEMRVKELNLGLVQPSSAQFWRVREPLLELPEPATDRPYARPVGPQARR
jgi:cell division protein FtsB